jgi:hypothetical protein
LNFDSERKADKLRLLRRDSSDNDFNASDESLIDLLSVTAQQARSLHEGPIKMSLTTPWGEEEEEKQPYRVQLPYTNEVVN